MPARCLGPPEPGGRRIPARPPRPPTCSRARPARRPPSVPPPAFPRSPRRARSGAAAAGAYLSPGGPTRQAPVAPANNGRGKASGAAQWARPACSAASEKSLCEKHTATSGPGVFRGWRRRGSGRRAAGVPAGIPEGPRGRPPAQVNVRAKTGCRAAETKTLPGGQGSGGGPRGRSGLWGGWWASGGQVGSEVEVKAGMVWVHRSILQTVGSPRIVILSTY